MNSFFKNKIYNYFKLFNLIILFLAFSYVLAFECKLEKGVQAPNFVLPDLKGNKIELKECIGKQKVNVIIIWGVWCPYCRAILVMLKDIYQEYKGNGLEIIAVSIRESPFKVSLFINALKPDFPVLIDEWAELKESYQLKDVPRIVLLNKDGIIEYAEITTSADKIKKVITQAISK